MQKLKRPQIHTLNDIFLHIIWHMNERKYEIIEIMPESKHYGPMNTFSGKKF